MTTLLSKTIRLFLESIGRREEYEFYLNKFRANEHPCFAVLCPERAGFEDVASFFSFDIQFLLELGLMPLILLCGEEAPEIHRLLEEEGHPYSEHLLADLDHSVETLTPFLARCRSAEVGAVALALDFTPDQVLPALIPGIGRRVHYIRMKGPLRGPNDEVILCYYTARPNPVEVGEDDRPLMQSAAALLEQRPGTHISVTSPWNLLKELFTVKGAGCLVRRGSRIRRVTDRSEIDPDRLAGLLEESFGRRLKNRDSFDRASEVYLEEKYHGAAMLETIEHGAYLSKFAVGTQARGEGLAFELWQELTRDHPRLFWRSTTKNPIYDWYEKQADGYHREGKWIVFWRGIDSEDVTNIIRFCLTRPEDFLPADPAPSQS